MCLDPDIPINHRKVDNVQLLHSYQPWAGMGKGRLNVNTRYITLMTLIVQCHHLDVNVHMT